MLLDRAPIQVFSTHDYGIDPYAFVGAMKPVFDHLSFDDYDAKKEQILFLQNRPDFKENPGTNRLFCDYYLGKEGIEVLKPFYYRLNSQERTFFDEIKPFRRRAVSHFHLAKKGEDWSVKRLPTPSFVQEYGKIKNDDFDFRVLPRTFNEIDESVTENALFKKLILGIASRIGWYHPNISKLEITVHHTKVETYKKRSTSNAPEGIHQDGYDYIVSALVIERKNVSGGESRIFAEDKTTMLLSTTLQPGYGILQPDKGTPLWHTVSKISVIEDPGSIRQESYRSSMGFDIALIE